MGQINHAVTVVGYNLVGSGLGADDVDETSLDHLGNHRVNFWKVQNSWGTWWGDNGFVRLGIDNDAIGVCGIN